MPRRRVGLLGCGTIGSEIALAVDSGKVANASLVSLFDIVESNAHNLNSKLGSKPKVYSDFASFLGSEMDLVIEAASQEAVRKFGQLIIQARKDFMIMSVGALASEDFRSDLLERATKNGCKIHIPTGAIAGMDAIRSVRHLLESVSLTTTKNPKALAGAPFFETSDIKWQDINKKSILYEGPASEAVKLFPANVNVAAVLSLAGIGTEKTQVRIVADPDASKNLHEIIAAGSFGEIRITVNNVPSPGNPKTSFLAVLSAIECLRRLCNDEFTIGS